MRVLFLSHRFADTKVGGLAEFLHFLPLALQKYDVDSFLYTAAENDAGQCELQLVEQLDNAMPHYCGSFTKPRFLLNKKSLQPLIRLCQQEKIDVIHAQGVYRAGYMAMQLKKQLGLPYVVTSHSDILATNSQRAHRASFKRRCKAVLKQADFVTHLSPLMQQVADDIYITSNKSCLIHNGIDLSLWQQEGAGHDFLLAIGRLEPEKGFRLLLDVFARLVDDGIGLPLVIAGSGSDEARLRAQAAELNLTVVDGMPDFSTLSPRSVVFTGYVRGAQKLRLFKQAAMVLFATQPDKWQESFGIVQLEAMAAGKPIVASDMVSTRYLAELGMQATLVGADKQDEWVRAIGEYLEAPALGEASGSQNLLAAQEFDWSKVAKAYAKVYKKVI